jgi:hypothetical protein
MKTHRFFSILTVVAILFTACNKDEASITYPAKGSFGANILSDNVTSIKAIFPDISKVHSMKANVPKGMSLKIVLKGGEWFYEEKSDNWEKGEYNDMNLYQEFSVIKSRKRSDMNIQINSYTHIVGGDPEWMEVKYITIEYYENGATTPTKTKKLYITE